MSKPNWISCYHPADVIKNLNMLYDAVSVVLPSVPEITKDLPDTAEATASQSFTFDITVSSPEKGSLTYQWQKEGSDGWADVQSATSADLTIASWADTDEGTYRNKITCTFNNATEVVYTNECTVSTKA